ncbi:uncharacterized protein ATNIH1004_005966 [Aspergillus tanneri]|uniref:Uncharacterized protein n=1 Tax=Aspergillus tanneri TaxID=1220188 RepID=A0A5M9MMY1_9EURO|nr:uncharacterized protein ATNIH1004_005966 [Aspergillus tanneri]KAA8647276.1 hypothetical protein ATNIH1004_005966 [Aspergillus tanneri]
MSADLFAEFGIESASCQTSGTTNQPASQSQAGSLIPDLDTFETPHFTNTSWHRNESEAHAAETQALSKSSTSFIKSSALQLPKYDNGGDVLFDATLETVSSDETEDWGEFESAEVSSGRGYSIKSVQDQTHVTSPRNTTSNRANNNSTALPKQLYLLDSLSLDDKPQSTHSQPTGNLGKKITKTQSKGSIPEPPTSTEEEPFEEWGDFIDGPLVETSAIMTQQAYTQPPAGTLSSVSNRGSASQSFGNSNHFVQRSEIRPTNIPPPSVLLELFPQLFEQLRWEATQARKAVQQKKNIEDVAASILCTLRVAARVVSGRTLRWKRDSILSQSMRIGPARSGKSGGMKLNAVNRNEDIKEKQEAVDVIVMWRDRAGLFNSVIQASGRRPIQAISENTRATPASAEQGALKAPHACALCGLKRDERLPKIDDAVEDSFGEWWTDHWGHTDCRQFWERHNNMLSQR